MPDQRHLTQRRTGEKAGWLGGWTGGFLWVSVLAVVRLAQGYVLYGVAGLGLFLVAVAAIFLFGPWRYPSTRMWKLMLPLYFLVFASVAWALWAWEAFAQPGLLRWWSFFWILPCLIPLWTIGGKRWNCQGQDDMVRYEQGGEGRRHHRGKSSESILDKNAILAALTVQSGQTVLDAGCGNGYMAKEFSRLVGQSGRVYALDPDEIAIAALRQGSEGANIVAGAGDITTHTGLPDAAFDLIYVSTVVHSFTAGQMRGFAAEVRRLLSPRGRLAIVEIVKRATPFGPPLAMRLSPDDLKAALGMTPISVTGVGEYFYLQLFENTPCA